MEFYYKQLIIIITTKFINLKRIILNDTSNYQRKKY